MSDEPDYYKTLEIERDADDETLRTAYRRLAWRYHPDVAGPECLERMSAINVAYQTLIDPERRRLYDASVLTRDADAQRTAPRARAQREGLHGVTSGPFALRLTYSDLDPAPIVASAFSVGSVLWALGQIDGRITVVSVREGVAARELTLNAGAQPGTLQSMRLSPRGSLAIASGFSLGTRVWSVADGRTLWNTGANAPSGAMDAVVYDTPPYVRLATPDAPIALASDDPFRWAEDGRRATAIYSRPLAAQVSPVWLTPLRCVEDSNLGLLREAQDENWRTNLRALSLDGRQLLTFSTGRVASIGKAHTVRLWDLERRNFRGAPEPRAVGRISEPVGMLQNPVSVTPDLRWVAVTSVGRLVRVLDLRNRRQRPVEVGRIPVDARIALSADGAWLAVARGQRLQVFATEAGEPRQEWEAGSEVTALAFSLDQDRAMLGVGLRSGLAELWSLGGR
jgi:hypothetical protein